MRSRNSLLDHNPLTHSVFVQDFDEGLVAPGNPKFLGTEDLKDILTEDNIFITTES